MAEAEDSTKNFEMLDIFMDATLQTKHISSSLHDDSFLYNSLFKVFTVFVQELGDDDEDPELMQAPTIKQGEDISSVSSKNDS